MRLHDPTSSDEFEVNDSKVARGFEGVDRKVQGLLLGPDLNGRKMGIPDYMEKGMILPALPPLYTHYHTPLFADRVTSPLEIRQGIANDSGMIEGSLRRLIDLEESTMKTESQNSSELFDETWRDMGFGEPPRIKATKWSFEIKV